MEGVDWHSLSAEQALSIAGSAERGLSSQEAERRLAESGPNELLAQSATSPLKLLMRQFTEPMVLILIAAAAISIALGEHVDAAVILIIVVLNAAVGFFQEHKAERALLALKQLSAPAAAVIRDGSETSVPARDVVPGDIIVLRTGDRVPADCRLIDSANLLVNESALTGESEAVRKDHSHVAKPDAFLGDRRNMVFSSTTVEHGRGRAVAVHTGMGTQIGRIADLIRSDVPDKTPLQRKLARLGKQIGGLIIAICALVFAIEVWRSGTDQILHMFMISVSLAVAAIPEGLPAVVTICLALGLQRMIRRHALVRKLPAVETLGSTTVICTDKTGTLTMGAMNIRRIVTLETDYSVSGEGYEPVGEFTHGGEGIDPFADPVLERLLSAGALCNDSRLVQDEGAWAVQGDPTEGAFIVAAGKARMSAEALNGSFPRVSEDPFDSEKKYMTTVHSGAAGFVTYTKGAADSVLPLCRWKMVSGKPEPLTEQDRENVERLNGELASEAYRVLALAFGEAEDLAGAQNPADGLVFLGLVGMIDAPRKEAVEAIRQCRRAGIRVVMITGDHMLTAIAIARQMGIARKGSLAYTGVQLDSMSDDELFRTVDKVAVYARVSPEHKMRIIAAWKRRGHIVAMTGDGVNDAPALKKADIGVAMGITGTDVSKEAADMVLTDDNFASIVHAVEVGRAIYDNIRKFVRYMLSTNLGEVLVIFSAAMLGLPLPLIAIQILWINLVTDGLPALSLSVEPPERDVMERRPRNPRESIFSGGMLRHIAMVGAIMTVGTLGLFAWALDGNWAVADNPNLVKAQTVAFITMALFQLAHVLAIRVERETVLGRAFFGNRFLLLAVGASAALQLAVVYFPPLAAVFKLQPLPPLELLVCMAVSSTVFLTVEAEKAVSRRKERPRRKRRTQPLYRG